MTKDDVEKALHGTLLWDRKLYRALVPALEDRRRFERGDGEDRVPGGNARMLLTSALHVAAVLVGQEALAQAYGEDPPADAPREEHLTSMWWRLIQIANIYAGAADHTAPSSLSALSDEIMAISHGDKATILAERPSRQGRSGNAWRLAHSQLAALEWEAYLRTNGRSSAEAQAAVCNAFGPALAWTTVSRWKKPILRELGSDLYNRAMTAAKQGHSFFSSAGMYNTADEESLRTDGERYKAELRRSLEIVEMTQKG